MATVNYVESRKIFYGDGSHTNPELLSGGFLANEVFWKSSISPEFEAFSANPVTQRELTARASGSRSSVITSVGDQSENSREKKRESKDASILNYMAETAQRYAEIYNDFQKSYNEYNDFYINALDKINRDIAALEPVVDKIENETQLIILSDGRRVVKAENGEYIVLDDEERPTEKGLTQEDAIREALRKEQEIIANEKQVRSVQEQMEVVRLKDSLEFKEKLERAGSDLNRVQENFDNRMYENNPEEAEEAKKRTDDDYERLKEEFENYEKRSLNVDVHLREENEMPIFSDTDSGPPITMDEGNKINKERVSVENKGLDNTGNIAQAFNHASSDCDALELDLDMDADLKQKTPAHTNNGVTLNLA